MTLIINFKPFICHIFDENNDYNTIYVEFHLFQNLNNI